MICLDCKSSFEPTTAINEFCDACRFYPHCWTSKDGERVYLGRVTSWSPTPQFPDATEVSFPTEGPFRVDPNDIVMLQQLGCVNENGDVFPIAPKVQADLQFDADGKPMLVDHKTTSWPPKWAPEELRARANRTHAKRFLYGADPGVGLSYTAAVVAAYDFETAKAMRPIVQAVIPFLEATDRTMQQILDLMSPFGIKPMVDIDKNKYARALDEALLSVCKVPANMLKGETTYATASIALREFRKRLGLSDREAQEEMKMSPTPPAPAFRATDYIDQIPRERARFVAAESINAGELVELRNDGRLHRHAQYQSKIFARGHVVRATVGEDPRIARHRIVRFEWRERRHMQHSDGLAEFIPTCGCAPVSIAHKLLEEPVFIHVLSSPAHPNLGYFLGYACVVCGRLQRFSEESYANVKQHPELAPDRGEEDPIVAPPKGLLDFHEMHRLLGKAKDLLAEDFGAIGLRRLEASEYVVEGDLERVVVKGSSIFRPVKLTDVERDLRILHKMPPRRAADGGVEVYREIRYADADKKTRFLDPHEVLIAGDEWNQDHPGSPFRIEPYVCRWELVKGALGQTVPKRSHAYETWHQRFRRPLGTSSAEQRHLFASMLEVRDPYKKARLAQVELGVDRDVTPQKSPTPYDPRIQVQDIIADDV